MTLENLPINIDKKSIMDHILELRSKIFISLGAVLLGSIAAHIYNQEIIAFILKPAGGKHLIFLSPLSPLFLIFKVDILVGFIIASPVISWCIFSYVKPAISKVTGLVVSGVYGAFIFLLVSGLSYAYFVTAPISLKFLFSISIPGIENVVTAESYFSFLLTQALILGLVFQIPIFILVGLYLNLFSVQSLSAKRRYVYAFSVIILSILTPTTDIFNLCVVLIPTLAIFEISLIACRIMNWMLGRRFW